MTTASLDPWLAAGLTLILLAGAGAVATVLLMAMGRLSLDLGWGRSVHALGPITIRIAAPREQVLGLMRSPYVGRTPRAPGIEILARREGLVVAAHRTKVHFYTARTVEAVEFEPPGRVRFAHLIGPVPQAEETFTLDEADGATEVRYEGEIGIDFYILGRIAGRRWVRPQWERIVGEHLEALKANAERQAR